jgi:molybdenum cofactor cytidylyltransferase
VAETALHAGLWPVVVVTGFRAAEVESALDNLPVSIVRNDDWAGGQSTSIRAGLGPLTAPQPSPKPKEVSIEIQGTTKSDLGRLPEGRVGFIGSAIFLLADQPQIPAEVLRALAETHARSLPAILAPLVLEEKRANPVLFDRVTFPDLLALTGDVGGRAIFDKHRVEYLPWHDDILLLDVDTPEDYERLKGLKSPS